MRIGPLRIACSAALLAAVGGASSAGAQAEAPPPPAAAPSSPAPLEPPPPPTAQAPEPPPPPAAAPAPTAPPVAAQPAAAQGQWAYTQQYGWVWMTYGEQSTYMPPGGQGEPLEYVYAPSLGWRWVVAPWVWGIGPWPYFGARGPGALAWYHHGWWRTPSRWRFEAAPVHGEAASRGVRPAPAWGARQARAAPRERPARGHEERGDRGARREGEPRAEGGRRGEGGGRTGEEGGHR